MKNIFVKTKNIRAFISLVTKLKNSGNNTPKMGLVYGEPGLGKTRALVWLAIRQNCTIVTAKNGMTERWFLSDLVEELGETPKWYSADLFHQAVPVLISSASFSGLSTTLPPR